MSSVALYRDFDLHLRRPPRSVPRSAPARARPSIFRRIVAAIERSHQRHVERQAARFIAKHGGRLTDDLERQLGEHLSGRGLPPYHL